MIDRTALLDLSASRGSSVLSLLARSLAESGQTSALRQQSHEPILLGWEVASCILDSVLPLARIEAVCRSRGVAMRHHVVTGNSRRRRRGTWLNRIGQEDSDSSESSGDDNL